jgi:hypothetical protein
LSIIIPNILETFNDLYYNYHINLNNEKANHLRWILENRFTSNNNIVHKDVVLNSCKINKFYTINPDWGNYSTYFTKKLNIVNSIITQLNINFDSVTNSIQASPNMRNYTNLTEFLFEARPAHDLAPNNPLGIQGINHNIDEVISMLDAYILEHRTERLERLNYHSNIMYILVNKLSPYIPSVR